MNAGTVFEHRRLGVGVAIGGLAFVALVHLGECRGGEKPRAEAKPAAKLIDAIVSRNKAPKIVKWPSGGELEWAALFPKGYDWREEDRVCKAIKRLEKDETEEVWEELAKRAGDRRYSQTVTSGVSGDAFTLTVGTLCERLAYARLVGVYWKHLPAEGLYGKYPRLNVEIKNLSTWRKKRAGKALYELQIEICEGAIQALKAMPDERVSDAEKERFNKKVEAEIASLKKTKEPLHRKGGYFFFEDWGVYNEELAAQVREGVKTGKYDRRLINK